MHAAKVPLFHERVLRWESGQDIWDLYVVLVSCLSGLALGSPLSRALDVGVYGLRHSIF